MNFYHAFSQSLMIAGYPVPPLHFQRLEYIFSSIGSGSRISRLQVAFGFVPVFLQRELKKFLGPNE